MPARICPSCDVLLDPWCGVCPWCREEVADLGPPPLRRWGPPCPECGAPLDRPAGRVLLLVFLGMLSVGVLVLDRLCCGALGFPYLAGGITFLVMAPFLILRGHRTLLLRDLEICHVCGVVRVRGEPAAGLTFARHRAVRLLSRILLLLLASPIVWVPLLVALGDRTTYPAGALLLAGTAFYFHGVLLGYVCLLAFRPDPAQSHRVRMGLILSAFRGRFPLPRDDRRILRWRERKVLHREDGDATAPGG